MSSDKWREKAKTTLRKVDAFWRENNAEAKCKEFELAQWGATLERVAREEYARGRLEAESERFRGAMLAAGADPNCRHLYGDGGGPTDTKTTPKSIWDRDVYDSNGKFLYHQHVTTGGEERLAAVWPDVSRPGELVSDEWYHFNKGAHWMKANARLESVEDVERRVREECNSRISDYIKAGHADKDVRFSIRCEYDDELAAKDALIAALRAECEAAEALVVEHLYHGGEIGPPECRHILVDHYDAKRAARLKLEGAK